MGKDAGIGDAWKIFDKQILTAHKYRHLQGCKEECCTVYKACHHRIEKIPQKTGDRWSDWSIFDGIGNSGL